MTGATDEEPTSDREAVTELRLRLEDLTQRFEHFQRDQAILVADAFGSLIPFIEHLDQRIEALETHPGPGDHAAGTPAPSPEAREAARPASEDGRSGRPRPPAWLPEVLHRLERLKRRIEELETVRGDPDEAEVSR